MVRLRKTLSQGPILCVSWLTTVAGQRQRAQKSEPESHGASGNQQKGKQAATLADLRQLNGLHVLGPDAESSIRLVSHLEVAALAEYITGSPRTDLLLGLVQLNVLWGLIVNMDVLGLSATEMHDDALSPFSTAGTWRAALT